MCFDLAMHEIGIKLVGQRNRGNRYARLQASGNHLRLEFGRVSPTRTGGRRGKYGSVHVSTKKFVDTIFSAGGYVSNVEWLAAYETERHRPLGVFQGCAQSLAHSAGEQSRRVAVASLAA